MPYIGNNLATQFQAFATQTITGDGSTGYTLDRAVANGKELLVYINNVKQEEGSGKSYTASGTTITFSEAVASGDSCYLVYMGSAQQTVTAPAGSIVSSQLATAFPSASLDMNGTELILDADGDTSITADTDDQIDFKIAGADFAKMSDQTLTLTSSTSSRPGVLLLDTNADANPPFLRFQKDSASPADNDEVGAIQFYADDDGGNVFVPAQIKVVSDDVSNGSENGSIKFETAVDGTTAERMLIDKDGNLSLAQSRFRIYTNATTGFSVSTPSNGNSVVDTDLQANEYGTYLISLYARPNPGGSSIYADNIVGVLSCIGSYDGGLTYRIKFTELYNHSASSNTDITLSFVFHDGSGGESTQIANGAQTIRAKVGGQATGYEFSGARLVFYQLNAGSIV
tara:strand:+ start:719 stop:1915 length:1197 start_codon:yes stop_codon:yes gene_type:complete